MKVVKHHMGTYREEGKRYVESWLQVNLLGRCYCFSKRRVRIDNLPKHLDMMPNGTVESGQYDWG